MSGLGSESSSRSEDGTERDECATSPKLERLDPEQREPEPGGTQRDSRERPESSEHLNATVVAALYREHSDELRAFLTGVLKNAELAADVLQVTFTRAIEKGQRANEETRKGWLFRVAFNEAMQVKRRGRIHDRATRTLAGARTDVETRKPEEKLVRREDVERVREALNSLPEAQRTVVCKRIYEEKTFAVIAEELGLPLGTVLTRMRLATRKLSRRLRERTD